MTSQELRIAVLNARLTEEIGRSVGLAVDLNMQTARADALQKELDALKAPKKRKKPEPLKAVV